MARPERERRCLEVAETRTELVIRQRPSGHVTFVRKAYSRWVRRPRELSVDPAWNDLDVLTPERRRRIEERFARFTLDAPVHEVSLETWEVARPLFSHWIGSGIFDDEGRLVEAQAVGRDVTGRVLAERAREEIERMRRAALEAALDGTVVMDADGLILEFCPAAERIVGRRLASVVGCPRHEVLVPDVRRVSRGCAGAWLRARAA